MKTIVQVAAVLPLLLTSHLFAFEGRITATLTRGTESESFYYTVGTNQLRVERGEVDHPYAKNIVNLDTGDVTLIFPHNRSFMQLKRVAVTPQNLPPGIGQQPITETPALSLLPMPLPMAEKIELKAIGDKTNLLGFVCEKFEIKLRGETMEIWATDKLLPFQSYQQNQPSRSGPRMMEEQWAELLKARKLFPLLAILKFDNGVERNRFEVKSLVPEKINDDDGKLFQSPPDYQEIQPLPF